MLPSGHIPLNPLLKLRALLNQALVDSVAQGWIDVNTYAYQAFTYTDPLSIPEVMDYLAEQVADNGILTTHDLTFANEMLRQLRALKHSPQPQPWWWRLIS
ncbi:MAG: hypothetical protein IGS50_12475 [Synechococcales cyanobacterium C42_A2020_086]|jgi:hypothetical protein|nr:hypothetical protein [Synechococcales cyanobacterium C42_A2020_086]